MSGHEHAIDLITRRMDGLAAEENAWLERHLAECADCSEYAFACEGVGELLRSVAVTASPALVSSTQLRLHARAEQLRDQQARLFLIALSFCVGALASAASAFMWWRFGGWVIARLGLPESILAPGVLVVWLLPAVLVAVLMLAYPHSIAEGSLLHGLVKEQEGENR